MPPNVCTIATSRSGAPPAPIRSGDGQPATAAAGDHDHAPAPRDRRGEVEALLGADEVEDDVDSATGVRCDDAIPGVRSGQHAVVGADLGGEVQVRAVHVDGEHADLGRGPQELHREMAQAADPDDDGRRPGLEQRPRALDGVQRRHPGVGQGRGVHRIDVAQGHDVARRDDDVVGHAAVARDSDGSRDDVPAHVVVSARARDAPAATQQLVDRHDGPATRDRHALAERHDLAHGLVAERHRQREPVAAAPQQGEVRPADARGQHTKQNLARPRHRERQVDELRPTGADQPVGAHASMSLDRDTLDPPLAPPPWDRHG